jgi:hypothetical protein
MGNLPQVVEVSGYPRILARLPCGSGREVTCNLTATGIDIATWIRDCDGAWWSKDGPPEASPAEIAELKRGLGTILNTLERGEPVPSWTRGRP